MLFKNFSSFGFRNSSVRCRDRIMSRPARKVKLRSTIPTTSSLLVDEIDPEISKHADGHPIYNMEEIPPIIGRGRRFPDEFSSGSPISGKSKRTEDIFIREDEDGIRSHYCPLNPELDGRDWNEDNPETFDFNFEKLINCCSVPSEDIPLLLSSKGLSSESDEESDGSVISYAPLESEASTSRNSTVSLTNVGYAPLENEPSTNENSPVSQKKPTPRFLQLPEKNSSYARLEEETMEAWLDDSSDEFEYYAPHVKYLPDVKYTIQDVSDMEEFEQDSDSENENDNLKSAKNKEKKDGGYKDKGDRDGDYKDFVADSKYSKNKVENESSTEYPSKLSKIEHSESKNACKNKQLSNRNAQDGNENEEEYPEINKDEGNKDLSTYTTSTENNAKNESSTEPLNKMRKIEHLKSENDNKNEQTSNLNTQDENQKEKEHVKINSESDSVVKDLHYSDTADRNNIESNLNTQDENKDKKGGKESENASKNEQSRNLHARDENQNKKKHPKYNIESCPTALDIHLLDNVDRNGIESNLNIQDDYKDKKGEKGSENSNKNEQPTNLNAEDENQNEKKYPDYNIESDSFAIYIPLLDNVDRNGIESNLSTQDDYKDKKEEKGSESSNENEQPTNLNAEDENQNQKKYPENSIENDSFAIYIPLLDNVDRNGIESNLSTQDNYKDKKEEKGSESSNENERPTNLNAEDENQNEKKYPENSIESNLSTQDDYKDKKEERGSESSNENEQPINLNAEDENQNEKKYPENNIESDSTAINILLIDNADRNDIESNMKTHDDNKDKNEEKESESTNKNEKPTNLNAEDENQNEKKYLENNLENYSTETDIYYLDITDRNGIKSNLNNQEENKDEKEESEKDSKNDYFSEDMSLPDFDNINGPVSNLNTYSIARLKFRDLLRTLLADENKDKKAEPESDSKNGFISGVIPLEDFDNINRPVSNLNIQDENKDKIMQTESYSKDDYIFEITNNINGPVSNLSIQDENKDKNIQTERDSKEDYIFEITNFRDFVSLHGSVSNLNTQDENNGYKTQEAENDLKNDYIFDIISFPDFVSLNGSASSLRIHDKIEHKKELESDSKNYFISEGISLTDSDSINEPVSNLTTRDENKDKKEHPESDLKTDYISEGIHWADFDSVNVPVSNSNTQDKNKVKKEHPESNLETGFAENFLHCADDGQKEEYVSEIGGFPNKMDDNRNGFSLDFFPKSLTKPAIKPKIKENMATLTAEPYGRTILKSIKKDEMQPGHKNELHCEPSITRDEGDKMPLEEKGIIFDINDALRLADLPVHDSGGFQPVLTEEQRVASRQPNKLTKFFQSLKKKLERNKKA